MIPNFDLTIIEETEGHKAFTKLFGSEVEILLNHILKMKEMAVDNECFEIAAQLREDYERITLKYKDA